jgi:hypothetical protein
MKHIADYEHVLASGAALSIGEPIVHYGAAREITTGRL